MAMQVELVSPESIGFSGEATMVLARTPAGEIAFQPGHIPFVGVLSGKGPVKIWLTSGTIKVVAVHSGFIEVSNDHITILSDVYEMADGIDATRARAAKDQAEARLREHPDDKKASEALTRASLRLAVSAAH